MAEMISNNVRRMYILVLVLMISAPGDVRGSNKTFNVRDFGAKGDGTTLDTKAIQTAIDKAAARGGGTVLLPPGTYLSGTIFMKSNIALHIDAGATLLGSTNIGDYPRITPEIRSYNDAFHTQSLLYGENLENIALTGRGTIDGQGGAFKVTTKKKPDRYRNRPFNIWFVSCRYVLVEDLMLTNSAMWMQQYLACDYITIRGLRVFNHCNLNNDMIDIDGCRNVVISDCFGDSDDDAITLKSTSGRMTENVTITNCVISSHVNAIKLGTESHAGFRNINISNIVVKPSESDTLMYGVPAGLGGITLGMVDGGILEGVTISNVRIDGAKTPIFMRLGDRGRVYKEGMARPGVGIFRNVTISNVIATGAGDTGCSITGIPGHDVEDITLENIRITFSGGGTQEDAQKEVPENREGYPGSGIFGKLPSYGFFIRHARNVTLDNIDLSFEKPDHRFALICDDVQELDIHGFRVQGTDRAEALVKLTNTRDVIMSRCRVPQPVKAFLLVAGGSSANIRVFASDVQKAETVFTIAKEVEGEVVRVFP